MGAGEAIRAAYQPRFDNIISEAIALREPEARRFQALPRMLKTEEDIDSWVIEVKQRLNDALKQRPVTVS